MSSKNASVLSPQAQERVNEKSARWEGVEKKYTTCLMNGCWDGCLLECSVKNGKIVSIDIGDPINANNPREEVGKDAVNKGMMQHRPCVRGRMWRRTIDSPNRLLHPMKNIGKKGDPVWERVTWEEALDEIAQKFREITDEYGPYAVRWGSYANGIALLTGIGLGNSWGIMSWAGHELGHTTVFGVHDMMAFFMPNEQTCSGSEAADLLNTSLIIGLGWNPAVTHAPYAHVLSLAKEQGIPIILIDPRYTPSAQTYADQWIPIRPGEDLALMLAIANVIFKENLIDHDFVSKFVEPTGLEKWRAYVTGESDGIDKTPEWACELCGIPAKTITELARLYGSHHGYSDGKSCYFKSHWSIARKPRGEDTARAGMYLQALTGNIGVPGGCHSGGDVCAPLIFPAPQFYFGMQQPTHAPATLVNVRNWVDAVIYRDDFYSGDMSEEEYRARIGSAKDWPLPNFHASFNQMGTYMGTHGSERVREAYRRLDFVVSAATSMDFPEVSYSDIVLPLGDNVMECPEDTSGGFMVPCHNGTTANGNFYIMKQKIVDAPGDAKSMLWINCQLAKRFGVLEQFASLLADVLDDQLAWDARIAELQRGTYETWSQQYLEWATQSGADPAEPPTWDEFVKRPLFRVPMNRKPFYGFQPYIQGDMPFGTPSGKIEFYSEFLADSTMSNREMEFYGQKGGLCYGGITPSLITPMAEYHELVEGLTGEIAKKYPLHITTPHSFFRIHATQDNNQWMPDEARHAVWISVADAAARGIKDGDLVHVFNDHGELIMPAYVTEKTTPDVISVIYGAWTVPAGEKTKTSPDGIDMRGAGNELTTGEQYPWVVGNLHCSSQVQVELYRS